MNSWPDGAMTPFRSEKDTNWEGAFRVPCLVRWPGQIKAGTVTNELMSHNDWIPTPCAIAGEPDIKGKLREGYAANGKTYKAHLDGYDQSSFLRQVGGTATRNNGVKSARNPFYYTDDDGLLVAMRHGDYKYVYAEQRLPGTLGIWAEPFTKLRLQKIFNLFQDPTSGPILPRTPTGIGTSTRSAVSTERCRRCSTSPRRSRSSRRGSSPELRPSQHHGAPHV